MDEHNCNKGAKSGSKVGFDKKPCAMQIVKAMGEKLIEANNLISNNNIDSTEGMDISKMTKQNSTR